MTDDANLDSKLDEERFLMSDDLPFTEPGFCLNAQSDWGALAFGFKKAADLLVSAQLEIFRHGDYTVYPIVYLYRHHIELALKEIISRGGSLLDPPVGVPPHHSLRRLWTRCKRILKRLDIGDDIPELQPFENSIQQLGKYDQTSESFRYPLKRFGQPALPPDLESIDIENLRRVAEGMSTFLDITLEAVRERAGEHARGL